MSTTTIRLPDDLKKRLSKVAQRLGSSSHALIVDAISDRVESEERRTSFIEEAQQRFSTLAESGKSLPWEEMKVYLQKRASGEKASRPKPRKLAR